MLNILEKGKPIEKQGRKITGLRLNAKTAVLPQVGWDLSWKLKMNGKNGFI